MVLCVGMVHNHRMGRVVCSTVCSFPAFASPLLTFPVVFHHILLHSILFFRWCYVCGSELYEAGHDIEYACNTSREHANDSCYMYLQYRFGDTWDGDYNLNGDPALVRVISLYSFFTFCLIVILYIGGAV